MAKLSDERRKSRLKKMIFFLIATGLFSVVILMLPFYRVFERRDDLNQEVDKLQGEINRLEEQNKDYIALLDYLKSSQYLEDEARTQLGLKKEGEQVILVESQGTNKNQANTTPTTDLSNWQKWWQYFFATNKL